MKQLLILGAGRVSAPLIRYFLSRRDVRVVIASNETSVAELLVERLGSGKVVRTDVTVQGNLEPLIRESNAVVSLLPAPMHPPVARLAVQSRVPFISTSYQSPEIAALNDAAAKAGVLLLSETGLDPGLDHMSAAQTIDRLQSRGATISRFSSCCGGFPAPDSHNNPWGYKFSWNPRGVVMAGRQDARYLRDGDVVAIPGPQLFEHRWRYEIEGEGVFEIYPNRDSLPYVDVYGLEGVKNIFRGTIRYPGWCATMSAAANLGLFDLDVSDWPPGATYSQFLTRMVPGEGSLIRRVSDHLGVATDSDVILRLEWAGFFSDRAIGVTRAAPIDVFLQRLESIMSYQPGERDMIALQHQFTAEYPDLHQEHHTSVFTMTGDPWGDSAMARCVALPAAIAARLALEGRIHATGAHLPTIPEIYHPVLSELGEYGIEFRESFSTKYPSPVG